MRTLTKKERTLSLSVCEGIRDGERGERGRERERQTNEEGGLSRYSILFQRIRALTSPALPFVPRFSFRIATGRREERERERSKASRPRAERKVDTVKGRSPDNVIVSCESFKRQARSSDSADSPVISFVSKKSAASPFLSLSLSLSLR